MLQHKVQCARVSAVNIVKSARLRATAMRHKELCAIGMKCGVGLEGKARCKTCSATNTCALSCRAAYLPSDVKERADPPPPPSHPGFPPSPPLERGRTLTVRAPKAGRTRTASTGALAPAHSAATFSSVDAGEDDKETCNTRGFNRRR